MNEILLVATTTLSALTVILLILVYFRLGRVEAKDPITKETLSSLLRGETDIIKSSIEDQSRGQRQELNENLKNVQTVVVTFLKTFGEGVSDNIRDFSNRLDGGIKTIDERSEALGTKLNADISQMGIEANANREALRQTIESKLEDSTVKHMAAARDLRLELNASFEQLGKSVADTLTQASEQQKERLDTTNGALASLTEAQTKSHESLRQIVEGRLDALRQENATKLDEMRQTVDEKLKTTLETRLDESFSRVVEQLTLVYQGLGEMKDLAANVGNLRSVLTNVKVRGTFGEVQLSMLLDEFLSPDQYVKDAAPKEGSNERVEYAIRFRMGGEGDEILLPIDAKFPREDYDRLIEASDAGDTQLIAHFRKQLENRIKSSARDIRDKYINPPRTTEFGILFLPTESLYAEVLRQPGLFEYLQRECRVTLAGPTTFAAILHAFQMNFRSLSIAKRSSEVWNILSAVRTEFGKYNEVVDRLGKQLGTAATSVENLGRRTKAMNRKLKLVETLPDQTAADEILGLTADPTSADEEEDVGSGIPGDASSETVPSLTS